MQEAVVEFTELATAFLFLTTHCEEEGRWFVHSWLASP